MRRTPVEVTIDGDRLDDEPRFFVFVGHSWVLDQRTRVGYRRKVKRISLTTFPADGRATNAPVEVTIDGDRLDDEPRFCVRSGSAELSVRLESI